MKNAFKITAVAISMLIGTPAFSQAPADALSSCMVDNLNGKERKSLAKWIFFAIGAHPDIKSYMQATPADMRASDEYVGSLITRLLTVDCPAPLKAAYAANPASLENAFGVVGEVAMQELMTNEDVNKTLTNYVHFTDTDKIDKLLK
jgi:hypothetical protein